MTSLSDTCVLSRAGALGCRPCSKARGAGGWRLRQFRRARRPGPPGRNHAGAKRLAGRRRRSPCRHPVSRQSCRLTHSEDVMEQITLSFPASRALSGRALAGVVGSGDMEVLHTAAQAPRSAYESPPRWIAARRAGGPVRQVRPRSTACRGQLIIHDWRRRARRRNSC